MTLQSASTRPAASRDDVWVHTACDYCNANCPIVVHRVNGVVIKIEGDPDSPHSRGRLCSKGQSALMTLYDPNRLTTPLKRTNPEKGLGIDPKFVPISWEEALTTVAQRLGQIRKENPQKLIVTTWDVNGMPMFTPWSNAFGTANNTRINPSCGDAIHPLTYLINGTFQQEIDLDYCNYAILLGAQYGFNAGVNATLIAQKMADARMRGMKVVVVDPVGTNAAAKADEWVPIRPGTDAALALAMVNLLINEYGLYDAEFLKHRSNAPYLVGPDGSYVRDPSSRKPLVWDTAGGRAVPFDTAGIAEALEGTYKVGGVQCKPAFQLLKEHTSRYTPEMASEITTVPPATIRRIARDFGEAAKIGSTIVIGGKELPLRPAAIKPFNGVMRHAHATLTGLAVLLLNLVIGGIYVPGSYRGTNLIGPDRRWHDEVEPDGLLVTPEVLGLHDVNYYTRDVRAPETINWGEMLPFAHGMGGILHLNMLDPQRIKNLPYRPEAIIVSRTNPVMTGAGPKQTAEVMRRIPFVVCFAQEIDETGEFADIIFPDTHALERCNLFPQRMRINVSPASGQFYWGLQQPVVDPPPGVRHWVEVLFDLAERMGFREEFNITLNTAFKLRGDLALKPEQKYTYAEVLDRRTRNAIGLDKGLDYLKQHGQHTKVRTVEEAYPIAEVKARFPIYFEIITRHVPKIQSVAAELGYHVDTSDYMALPDWKPCPAYNEVDPEFDLFGVNYKVPMHHHSVTARNPWLTEVSDRHPYFSHIMIGPEAARRRGIKDGDQVWVESTFGGKQKAIARVTECIHPEVVGIAGVLGGWASGKGAGRGKGVHYASLLSLTEERIDWISSASDQCIRLKVTKATP